MGAFQERFAGGRRCRRRAKLLWGQAGGEASLTRVVGDRARQAEPEELPKGDGLKDGVGTRGGGNELGRAVLWSGPSSQKPDHQQLCGSWWQICSKP